MAGSQFCRWVERSSIARGIPLPVRYRSSGRTTKTLASVIFLLSFFLLRVASAQTQPIRRVLILNEVGAVYPVINLVDQGIRTALDNSGFGIEFYREYFDTTLFPDAADQQRFRDFYIRKYQNRKPDVIITVGSTPLQFMVDAHSKFFSGVPIVFCLAAGLPERLVLDSNFTGVQGPDAGYGATIAAALRLKPETRRVVVVGGQAPYDRQQEATAKDQLKSYQDGFEISYLTELDAPALLQRLKQLPDRTIVLMTALGRDAAGTTFDSSESGPMVVHAANAPVFSVTDRFLNHGEVGGDISSGLEQGRIAGDTALRLLRGERPQDIPVVKSASRYMFDWRALRRWGLKESNLPPGSIVLNREPTIWEAYKWYIVGSTSVTLLETLLIFGLLWQQHRRKKAEAELAFTYDGLCLAVEAGKSVGWDWNLKNGRARWFGDLQTMFGMQSDTYSGDSSELSRRVHPEDNELVWKAIDVARRDKKSYVAEFRVIRIDGAIRWITAAGKFYYGRDGGAERMLGMAVDITERKRVEETLAGISRKLLQAQEQERSRIARELHDNLNQRLAMLAVELETVQAICPDLPLEIHTRLQELRKQTMEISTDVQALSHELHTSKLEYLGVVAAMKSWCGEFSKSHSIEINFKAHVSSVVPPETALALFRVLQEAVHNAAKYSGVKQFSAQIVEDSDGIDLLISDSGRGFDVEAAKEGGGLGLTSMQERVRLVNGTIAIQSRLMGGTSIHVHVPLERGHEDRQAVG